ncbi:MAG TPA: hypothetical protein VMU14_13725 [Acidimicrobiales bacterium]|nr:hypothetical protein [Acidimicrobiales bacterium]
MTISDAEVQELVAAEDRGRDQWIHGVLSWEQPGSITAQADDSTIFGPFGGVAPEGRAPVVRPDVQRAIAAQFRGGTGRTEVIRAIVEGDLVILVLVDRSEVRFEGYDEPQPWELRITVVFRKLDGRFVRIHRHADPLVKFRDLEGTLALLTA